MRPNLRSEAFFAQTPHTYIWCTALPLTSPLFSRLFPCLFGPFYETYCFRSRNCIVPSCSLFVGIISLRMAQGVFCAKTETMYFPMDLRTGSLCWEEEG